MSREYHSPLYSFPGFSDLYSAFIPRREFNFGKRGCFESYSHWLDRVYSGRELTMNEYVYYCCVPDVTAI